MRSFALPLLWSSLALAGINAGPAAAQESVKGVWSIVTITVNNSAEYTPPEPGFFIFTDRHFSRSLVYGPNARKPLSDNPSDAERLAARSGAQMHAGTYEFAANRLVMSISVATTPARSEGRPKVESSTRFDGEFLYITNSQYGTTFKLRKVE